MGRAHPCTTLTDPPMVLLYHRIDGPFSGRPLEKWLGVGWVKNKNSRKAHTSIKTDIRAMEKESPLPLPPPITFSIPCVDSFIDVA